VCKLKHGLTYLPHPFIIFPRACRLSSLVLLRYLTFEEAALRKQRGIASAPGQEDAESSEDEEDAGDEEEEQEGRTGGLLNIMEFHQQKHQAYKSPVMIVLEGMMDFTHEQFQSNVSWIIPLLSRLIVCEDIEVRVCVRQIYQSFVNFLLIK
jgi:hypothetical protein